MPVRVCRNLSCQRCRAPRGSLVAGWRGGSWWGLGRDERGITDGGEGEEGEVGSRWKRSESRLSQLYFLSFVENFTPSVTNEEVRGTAGRAEKCRCNRDSRAEEP